MPIACDPWGSGIDIDGGWRSPSSWGLAADDALIFLSPSLARRLQGAESASGWARLGARIERARQALAARRLENEAGLHVPERRDVVKGWAFDGLAMQGRRLAQRVNFGRGRPDASRRPPARALPAAWQGTAPEPGRKLLDELGLAVLDRALPDPARLRGIDPAGPRAASWGALLSFHSGVNAAYLLPGQEWNADLFAATAWLGALADGRRARVPAAIADFIAWSEGSILPSLKPDAVDDPHLALRIALEASGMAGVFGPSARRAPAPALVWPTPGASLSATGETSAQLLLALFQNGSRTEVHASGPRLGARPGGLQSAEQARASRP